MGQDRVSEATIRLADERDLEAMLAISLITHREHADIFPHVFPQSDETGTAPHLRQAVLGIVDGFPLKLARAQVAQIGNQVVGFIAYAAVIHPFGEKRHAITGHVADISVAPEHRGHGLGTRLLAEAIADMKAHKINSIAAEIRIGNTASERAFTAAGFLPINRAYRLVLSDPVEGPMPAPPAKPAWLRARSAVKDILAFIGLLAISSALAVLIFKS